MHQVKVHYDCQEEELLQKEIIHGEENKMKKILAIALLLTVALVAVFAAESPKTSNAVLKYTEGVKFDPDFFIATTSGTQKVSSDIILDEDAFNLKSYEFGLFDKSKNNAENQSYTLSATCAGWTSSANPDFTKAISLSFSPIASTTGSTQTVENNNLLVAFDYAVVDRVANPVKIGKLTASWAAFAKEELLAATYSATVYVTMTAN